MDVGDCARGIFAETVSTGTIDRLWRPIVVSLIGHLERERSIRSGSPMFAFQKQRSRRGFCAIY